LNVAITDKILSLLVDQWFTSVVDGWTDLLRRIDWKERSDLIDMNDNRILGASEVGRSEGSINTSTYSVAGNSLYCCKIKILRSDLKIGAFDLHDSVN
jgi:hypothetical protein